MTGQVNGNASGTTLGKRAFVLLPPPRPARKSGLDSRAGSKAGSKAARQRHSDKLLRSILVNIGGRPYVLAPGDNAGAARRFGATPQPTMETTMAKQVTKSTVAPKAPAKLAPKGKPAAKVAKAGRPHRPKFAADAKIKVLQPKAEVPKAQADKFAQLLKARTVGDFFDKCEKAKLQVGNPFLHAMVDGKVAKIG